MGSCKAIGIDLGTTYCCVSVFQHGSIQILPNQQGNRLTPSYVAFTEAGELLVGDAAKNQATRNPKRTIYEFKRLMGRRFSDPIVQEDILHWPFQVVSDDQDRPKIWIETERGAQTYYAEEISGFLLSHLRKDAELALGHPVEEATVSVPAYFTESQRAHTKDAIALAGMKCLRIISEPTAACLMYGLDKCEDRTILVYDLGGGTFDTTLLRLEGGMFTVVNCGGDAHLGGCDFDACVFAYMLEQVKRKFGVSLDGHSKAARRLMSACEKAKRVLSSVTQTTIEVDSLHDGEDFQAVLTRAKFEELCSSLFDKTLKTVSTVLSQGNTEPREVDDVVLVGGSTRIPRVQRLLSEFFEGKQLNHSVNPDEVVAAGCGVQSAILCRVEDPTLESVLLLDIAPISIGIKVADGSVAKVIPRQTPIPAEHTEVFSTYEDNQSSVDIHVYEGERYLAADCKHLGTFTLSDLPPAPRGVPQIAVTFSVSADNLLTVTARDKASGRESQITITSDGGRLSSEEIARLTQEAEAYRAEDERLRAETEARNALECYLYESKKALEQHSEYKAGGFRAEHALLAMKIVWVETRRSREEYVAALEEIRGILAPIFLQE